MESKPSSRRLLLAWLIISQLLALASLLIWLLIAGLSVMAFDQGSTPEAWALVLTVWAYPLIPLIFAIGAWIAYARRKNTLAAILSTVTFLPPVLFYLFLWITTLTYGI